MEKQTKLQKIREGQRWHMARDGEIHDVVEILEVKRDKSIVKARLLVEEKTVPFPLWEVEQSIEDGSWK